MPPNSTLKMSRFMASHMIFVRIAPLQPMREPTMVSTGLFSRKPSATNAQPEYEFKTVMQHGMSPPPTDPTKCTPITLDSAAVATISGMPPLEPKYELIMPICPASMAALSKFLAGRFIGAEPKLPLSLPKATRLPVSVTPPMKLPRMAAVLCTAFASGCSMCDPIAVIMAAKPTREWNAATVCGKAMGLTCAPSTAPPAPPAARRAPAAGSAAGGIAASVAARPPATPDMPMYAPPNAVLTFASAPIDPMHNSDDTTPVAGISAGSANGAAVSTAPGARSM
mmetsp:Transcript_52384/g.159206  ORF Transcript_52384/g.159206 Transcript_52384/m.159206 type:complete len:282 (-) Transcript_52384:1185-2030(-)